MSSYTEPGYAPITPIRQTDEEYGRTLQNGVLCCTDVVVIERTRKIIYLAHRLSKPMMGWWWIGGKMVPGDTLEISVVKNFQRETGLKLPVSRLQLVGFLDYRWKDRAQKPQDIGCHMMGITFVVELTEAELLYAAANLDPKEYQKCVGLVPFNRNQLVEENVVPPILKLYDYIFPSS